MTVDIALINPKFAHNVGAAVRAMSCFGEGNVLFTGNRIDDVLDKGRLPREERMKAYQDVFWGKSEKPLNELEGTPVALELVEGSVPLHTFSHPENAVYVFGPEDGSLPKGIKVLCHHFVQIPSKHCLNLAAAVYLTLYDRAVKRWQLGLEPMPTLEEDRGGWWTSEALEQL